MAMAYAPPRDPTDVMGRRIAAFIIDSIVTSVIVIAVLAATKSQSLTGAPTDACRTLRDTTNFSGQCVQIGSHVYTWSHGRYFLGLIVGLLIGAANVVLLQGITGASLGKMILGLRTVNAQGQPCGIGRAAVRWILLLVVDDFPYCFPLVGLITALVTHPHKRVGDMVANTYVVAAADAGVPIPSATGAAPYAYAGQPAWGAQPQQPAWGAQPATTGVGRATPTTGMGRATAAGATTGMGRPTANNRRGARNQPRRSLRPRNRRLLLRRPRLLRPRNPVLRRPTFRRPLRRNSPVGARLRRRQHHHRPQLRRRRRPMPRVGAAPPPPPPPATPAAACAARRG